jgi:hypothetical protein
VARDDDPIGVEIKASITLVIRGVAEEDAQGGPRGQLVRSSGGEIWIAGASKGPEVMIGGKGAMESEKRGAHVQSFGGEAIDEVGGCGESIGPI